MHIIVCVKQTPQAQSIQINPETGCLVRAGTAGELNPFDVHALEAAVVLKEQTGAQVSVLTMGPAQAEQVLRESIARGADAVFHLCDASFAGADTYATSYTLARAIEKIGAQTPADLIICGAQSTDGDTGHVGAQIAAWLNCPYAGDVKKIVRTGEQSIVVRRATEEGCQTAEVPFPCVISVLKEASCPRVAGVKGRILAKTAPVTVWNADDISADKTKTGLAGSPTRVVKTFAPEHTESGAVIDGENAREKARNLVARLKENNII